MVHGDQVDGHLISIQVSYRFQEKDGKDVSFANDIMRLADLES